MKITPYVQYESIDTWHLYQEFRSIPGNKMDVEMRHGSTMTTDMMHNILHTAYKLVGRAEMTRSH